MTSRKSIDPAALAMLEITEGDRISTAFSRADEMKPCPIGKGGACCRNCFMGPCRFTGKNAEQMRGVCGATLGTIAARNLARAIAAGAAAHSDHGRDLALTLRAVGKGEAKGYEIRDERKLYAVAGLLGVPTAGKSVQEVATAVGEKALASFGQQEGELAYLKRAPKKRQELWRKLNIAPRGIDREVVETLHRTHIGVDQDATNLLKHAMRTALSDGWGGSMLATDITDILFGTPTPVQSRVNLGVLQEDQVNLLVHGHEPVLSEMIVAAASEPAMIEYAKSKGAAGINLAGICCTANEILMRQGVPPAGNFLQQELAIATGVVDGMIVDVQCIMEGLVNASDQYHTKLITTSPKARIQGAMHIEFDEHHALEIARNIVKTTIDNYPNRKGKEGRVPDVTNELIAGFSHEYLNYMQGGVYRQSFRPFNEAVIAGRIRGAAGVVGCNNPRCTHDSAHFQIVRELIKNDVLVVQTGCSAITSGKFGLLTPEAMNLAGPGLREVCEAIGIPPVLHMGSCVDNSRILTVLTQAATEGGLGEDISDLPAIGIAPEWMSEKALSIGTYFVASGVKVIFGVDSPVAGSMEATRVISEGWEELVGGSLEFEPDPMKIVEKAIAHIDAKRAALKLEPYKPERFGQSGDARVLAAQNA
ncbi:MAG: anaerobic carbon-monoxide dehydrogenase catalytic subunit [Chloroflexi bacterium]|nr:anaerobic carbon-monoxide dehydrogenase catalytic subunit [Chloroflexota bacterium]MCL5110288.1 anaerobic carbon-monoxide dehydrogenase catalytic subunit [Chloroflexota bacterium]MDA8216545.1 anaerobic carbon-monoxide dehydrogenase catalytic subunit [Dehalococcoidales bacterium]